MVFWKGTPQELEVYRIYGRYDGPTVMIMGGIQGDEPGGFLSADLYADLALKRGNLIVVPRANFRSVVQSHRGPGGDMNRKFEGNLQNDPERNVVEILKGLMAESDVLLNLHDGSGYYRPTWESDMANPKRYGQCIITDTSVYTHPGTGRVIELEKYAEEVVRRVNGEIDTPLHKFHVFNMETVQDATKYKEQRKSASYFALTQLGIPAFGVETSKQLPRLEMKVHQHNLAVNAFLELYGVELEQPRIILEAPLLGYMVIAVNDRLPLAVADGQTLQVAQGDTIEIVHVGANYERGISVEIEGQDGLNDIRKKVAVTKNTAIVVRKDNTVFGRVAVELLPEDQRGNSPVLLGDAKIRPPRTAVQATPELLASLNPGAFGLPAATSAASSAGGPSQGTQPTADAGMKAPGSVGTSGGSQSSGIIAAAVADVSARLSAGTPGSAPEGSSGASANAGAKGPQGSSAASGSPQANTPAVSAVPGANDPAGPSVASTGAAGTDGVKTPGSSEPAQGGQSVPPASGSSQTAAEGQDTGGVTGFLIEVNGRRVEIAPGAQYVLAHGSLLKIVDLTGGALPKGVVMNLRGFVPQESEAGLRGEDRGTIADTAKDMMPGFSLGGKGEVYAINAEVGKKVLASCTIKIVHPQLESVTVRLAGETKTLPVGSRIAVPVGAKVELLAVDLKSGLQALEPRYTLAGHPVSATLPQTLTMRDIAINLAVFEGERLMGKVTWVPKK